MASDNRPNKDKRRRQNLAKRAAREARSAHAGEATARDGEDAREATPVTSSRAATRPSPSGGGGRDGDAPLDRRAAAKARMQARYPIPGQRSMFMALMFSVVFAVMVLIVDHPIPDTVDPDSDRAQAALEAGDADVDDDDEFVLDDDGNVDIIEYYKVYEDEARGPVGAGAIALFPLIVCGAAYYFKDNERRRNVLWTGSMLALTGFMVLATPFSIYMLPTLIAVGIGVFQYRKALNAPRMEELRRQREARRAAKEAGVAGADADETEGTVIEGDVVAESDGDDD